MHPHIRLEPALPTHDQIFATWNRVSPLAERTCRPICNGKRLPSRDTVMHYVCLVADQSEPVGRCVYFDVNPRNRSAEFGYIVNPNFRRQGIGYAMVRLMISHLFSTTDLNKLYCQTAAFNTPSIQLLDKLQLHRDGVLREHHERDGELWDDWIYSVLRREWQNNMAANPEHL